MLKYIKYFIFVSLMALFQATEAIPKYGKIQQEKTYSDNTNWNQLYHNENKSEIVPSSSTTKDRLERLGYTTGYGTLNGYPGGTGLSPYNPIKLDLGGVVLGTLVGIGAIIIIPKILQAFHGGYGGYGRSEDDNSRPFGNILNLIDNELLKNNIDSTSCMQRAVCSYVRLTETNMQMGAPDQIDEWIHMLSDNSVVDYLLDGSAIKEALEQGKKVNARPCEELYNSCSVDDKSAANVLMKLFPNKTDQVKKQRKS